MDAEMLIDYDWNRFPVRRKPRLKDFDYSSANYYFVTICTWEKKCIFGGPAKLSPMGEIAAQCLREIESHFEGIQLDKWVVMPNHIHMLLQINTDEGGRPMVAPTISKVVQQLKGIVTKQIGCSVWQKLFHDHVIRGEKDYLKIWEYIENNPVRWKEDCFYQEWCRDKQCLFE